MTAPNFTNIIRKRYKKISPQPPSQYSCSYYDAYDLCIVSPYFGKDIIDELQFLFKTSRHIDTRIEPYPVSSKDYKDIATPLIQEIRKYGKEIYNSI